MSFISSLVSSVSKPSLALGVGLGVVSSLVVSRYLHQQISELAHLDNEDNESGGEDSDSFHTVLLFSDSTRGWSFHFLLFYQ